VTYRKPEWVKVGVGLDPKPQTIVEGVPNGGDVQSLKGALSVLDWDHEYLNATLLSTHSSAGRTDAFQLKWYRTPQGTGEMEDEGADWVIRIGESTAWKRVEPPSSDVEGIWSLGNNGRSALLLTTEHGFYRTRDGAQSWEEANYNETGFTNGKKVKPIVVRGADATFALIDRGTHEGDGENPLFRLRHRGMIERWRVGLVQLLR
jgi:hypothetical protein